MKVRQATNRDTLAVVALVKEGLQEFGFEYAPNTSEADLYDIEATYLNNGGCFLVIEEKDVLVATGALKKVSEEVYKIRKMYVSKVYRKQGFGKIMLDALLEEAVNKNAKEIVLETSQLMIAAISLYKSYGFEVVLGKAESPRCDILMIKKL